MPEDESHFDSRLGPIMTNCWDARAEVMFLQSRNTNRSILKLAHELRELFETLFLMEGLGSVSQSKQSNPLSEANSIPKRLGEFNIVREIGRGGMGIVYEAVQESLDRHVAVKVLPHSTVLSADQVQRFQREARAAASLQHKNIVPVFGVGEEDGLHFYVMQYIEGKPLDGRSDRSWPRFNQQSSGGEDSTAATRSTSFKRHDRASR